MTPPSKRGPDLSQALLNPASVFAGPEEVLTHDDLSREQKIEVLRRWQYDASEEAVAVEEGMQGGESDLLRRIMIALERLDAAVGERTGASKQHGLPRGGTKPS